MAELKKYNIADITSGSLNLNKLNEEIEASSFVYEFKNIVNNKTDNTISVYGEELNNELGLDNLVLNHNEFDLSELKESRYDEIDLRTVELIGGGFVFDGKSFSLSTQAQNNWTNIFSNKETFNAFGSFPMEISTKDSDVYQLQYSDVTSFWAAGMVAVKTPYNVGGNLKKSIFDASTVEEVNSIIDNR